jgi:uncharacterized delta-60 repeat protein
MSSPTDLDPTFSGDGKALIDFAGADDVAHAVAVQSDGKIVVAGETQVTVNGVKKTAFAAIRLNPDGSLDDGSARDTTKGDKFGVAGKFTRVLDQGGGTGALALTIQKDGKIILAGNANKSANTPEWYFLRLNRDGTLDSGFGTKGVQSTSFPASVLPKLTSILLQPDGRLVAAGTVESNWFLLRLTTTGQFDNTFGGNGTGRTSLDFGAPDTVTALAMDNLGKIVVAGNIQVGKAHQGFAIARLLSDGRDDNSFGTNGRVPAPDFPGAGLGSLAVEPGGNILVGISSFDKDHTPVGRGVEFDNNGQFLGSSKIDGKSSATGLAVSLNDVPILGGTSINNSSAPEAFFVNNLNDSHENDVGFGSRTDHNVANALAMGADGKIVQVGFTTAGGGGRNFAIARYLGTPTSKLGAISGTAFLDNDGDGVKDPNELGLANRVVFVDSNNDGVFEFAEPSAITDTNANYKLFIAPGTYHVREILPGMSAVTETLPVATPGVYTVKVAAKQTVSGVDFGNAPKTDPDPTVLLSGSVFFDFNSNGKRDVQHPTEPDLAGRTIFLDSNRNGVLDTGETKTVTDAGGNYSFKFMAEAPIPFGVATSTIVRDILPAGWTHTNPSGGFFEVQLALGQNIVRNFGTTFADPDDAISEANAQPGNQVKVGGAVNFTIANVTDVDLVRFTATKGQRIGFDIDRAAGSSLNSFIRLFDATGKQIASNDDGAAPGEGKSSDSFLAFTFNAAGTFYLGVSNNQNTTYNPITGAGDNGAGSTGAYKLSLVNVPTAAAVSAAKIGAPTALFNDKPGDLISDLI